MALYRLQTSLGCKTRGALRTDSLLPLLQTSTMSGDLGACCFCSNAKNLVKRNLATLVFFFSRLLVGLVEAARFHSTCLTESAKWQPATTTRAFWLTDFSQRFLQPRPSSQDFKRATFTSSRVAVYLPKEFPPREIASALNVQLSSSERWQLGVNMPPGTFRTSNVNPSSSVSKARTSSSDSGQGSNLFRANSSSRCL